jgi:hypothetical protein
VVAVHPQQVELAALLILTMGVTLALIPVVIFRVLARQSEAPEAEARAALGRSRGCPSPRLHAYTHRRHDVDRQTSALPHQEAMLSCDHETARFRPVRRVWSHPRFGLGSVERNVLVAETRARAVRPRTLYASDPRPADARRRRSSPSKRTSKGIIGGAAATRLPRTRFRFTVPTRIWLQSWPQGRLAQLGEHQLDKLGVTGSSPVPPTKKNPR